MNDAADGKKGSKGKYQERNKKVVNGNSQSHPKGSFVFVHRHRVAGGNIIDRHFHIIRPENDFGEFGVHGRRKQPNGHR